MTSSVDLEAAAEEEDSVEEEVATEAMEVATTTAMDMVVAMEAMTTARDMVVAMEAMTTARDMVVVMEAMTTARDMATKVDMEVVTITRGADTVVRTAMEVANKEVVMASKRQAVGEGLVLVLLLQGAIIPTAVSKLQFAGGRRSGYRR